MPNTQPGSAPPRGFVVRSPKKKLFLRIDLRRLIMYTEYFVLCRRVAWPGQKKSVLWRRSFDNPARSAVSGIETRCFQWTFWIWRGWWEQAIVSPQWVATALKEADGFGGGGARLVASLPGLMPVKTIPEALGPLQVRVTISAEAAFPSRASTASPDSRSTG